MMQDHVYQKPVQKVAYLRQHLIDISQSIVDDAIDE